MTRKEVLKVCGNLKKHNFTRLTGCAANLSNYLQRTQINVTPVEAMMLLEDFEVQFYDDVFHCYRNVLAASVNDIRRGMRNYLMHQCAVGHIPGPHGGIQFPRPPQITNDYVAGVYIHLMYRVVQDHMFESFGVSDVFRNMY
jgi:hypothetical protein